MTWYWLKTCWYLQIDSPWEERVVSLSSGKPVKHNVQIWYGHIIDGIHDQQLKKSEAQAATRQINAPWYNSKSDHFTCYFVTLSAFVIQFYPRFSMLAGMLCGLSSNGSVCDVKFVHYTIYIWKLSNLSDASSYRTLLWYLSFRFTGYTPGNTIQKCGNSLVDFKYSKQGIEWVNRW